MHSSLLPSAAHRVEERTQKNGEGPTELLPENTTR